MLRTFNCGIGMIAIVEPSKVEGAIATLSRNGEQVIRLGTVVSTHGDNQRVTYSGQLDLAR